MPAILAFVLASMKNVYMSSETSEALEVIVLK